MAERIFAYQGVMQALMMYEREKAEGGGDGGRLNGGGRVTGGGPHESPRSDLADRTIVPLTREMVAAGAIPGMSPADRAMIEHSQV
jgi:hypothetical protein